MIPLPKTVKDLTRFLTPFTTTLQLEKLIGKQEFNITQHTSCCKVPNYKKRLH